MTDPCTCATFVKSDGSVWTMLRDPKCPQHGDELPGSNDLPWIGGDE